MCTGKRRFKMVAVQVTDTNVTDINWGTDGTLADATIVALEAFSTDDFLKGPGNKSLANVAAFQSAFLNIRSKKSHEDVLANVPLERLRAANNAGEPFRTCDLEINPSDCKISIGNTGTLVANEWFFIGVHYTVKNDK